MAAVRVNYNGVVYTASHENSLIVVGRETHRCIKRVAEVGFKVERGAYLWLGNMGLHARLSRRLLDAAIRGIGPLANVKHPRRVA